MRLDLQWAIGAIRDLRSLDRKIADRIMDKLDWIMKQDDPLRHSVVLHDAKIGNIRFRIGDYRVVGILDRSRKKVTIVAIGHRREIYR